MTAEALIAQATASMSGILIDVFTAMSGVISIMIVLVAARMIYAVINQQPIIPEGMFSTYDEREYEEMLEQEEKKYHQGIMRNNAKLEIKERHKYDL